IVFNMTFFMMFSPSAIRLFFAMVESFCFVMLKDKQRGAGAVVPESVMHRFQTGNDKEGACRI
ncbi:hypothetical protein, partial [Serratia marcescens]|uniref:hypothetical protein n=1 Tax=Serratia marcescens TaxID=615 RepID=UPI001BCA9CD3